MIDVSAEKQKKLSESKELKVNGEDNLEPAAKRQKVSETVDARKIVRGEDDEEEKDEEFNDNEDEDSFDEDFNEEESDHGKDDEEFDMDAYLKWRKENMDEEEVAKDQKITKAFDKIDDDDDDNASESQEQEAEDDGYGSEE